MDGVSREGLHIIWFDVLGKAQGKGRPRFTRSGHTYTPDSTRIYEDMVRAMYRQACKEPPTDAAVKVCIVVWMIPAKSLSKKQRAKELEHPPMKKPDIDNISKIILDALNGVAWNDDKQVVSLEIVKLWGHDERVMVGIKKESEEDE